MPTDSSSWWARKLGGAAPPATTTQSYPQQQQQQPQAQPYGQQPQYPPPGGHAPASNAHLTPDNFMAAAGQWQGGKATKTETSRCPNCGGDHYFSQTHTNPLGGGGGGAGARIATERGMANTSPRCFDCGYSLARPLQTGSMS